MTCDMLFKSPSNLALNYLYLIPELRSRFEFLSRLTYISMLELYSKQIFYLTAIFFRLFTFAPNDPLTTYNIDSDKYSNEERRLLQNTTK